MQLQPSLLLMYMSGSIVVHTMTPFTLPDIVRIDRLKIFLDSMGGGAWPFLVGGVICLVNSVTC